MTTENTELKLFRIYPKNGALFTIKAHSMNKIMEGMVIFHNLDGSVAAAFTTAELIGFFEISALVPE